MFYQSNANIKRYNQSWLLCQWRVRCLAPFPLVSDWLREVFPSVSEWMKEEGCYPLSFCSAACQGPCPCLTVHPWWEKNEAHKHWSQLSAIKALFLPHPLSASVPFHGTAPVIPLVLGTAQAVITDEVRRFALEIVYLILLRKDSLKTGKSSHKHGTLAAGVPELCTHWQRTWERGDSFEKHDKTLRDQRSWIWGALSPLDIWSPLPHLCCYSRPGECV